MARTHCHSHFFARDAGSSLLVTDDISAEHLVDLVQPMPKQEPVLWPWQKVVKQMSILFQHQDTCWVLSCLTDGCHECQVPDTRGLPSLFEFMTCLEVSVSINVPGPVCLSMSLQVRVYESYSLQQVLFCPTPSSFTVTSNPLRRVKLIICMPLLFSIIPPPRELLFCSLLVVYACRC